MSAEKKPLAVVPASGAEQPVRAKRTKIKQSDVPGYSLDQALRVPRAIAENYAYKPTKPLHVASAMGMQPNAGPFRGLTGAAIAYGLTSGGSNAPLITIEKLGMRIVRPTKEGDDLAARREAFLKPRIIGEFLRQYNDAALPADQIARHVLHEMGVPTDKTEAVLALIVEGAESLDFLRQINKRRYVDLDSSSSAGMQSEEVEDTVDEEDDEEDEPTDSPLPTSDDRQRVVRPDHDGGIRPQQPGIERRVFVTHGKNQSFIPAIKRLLQYGEMEPVVAVERQSVSQPVPDKVMADMRSCGAAIIHVDAERRLFDTEAQEEVVIINQNVVMEIGAAMALYQRRFILLVREGVKLPSNLQGLYEVRYNGDSLDGEATIRLLEAIGELKKTPLPERYLMGSKDAS